MSRTLPAALSTQLDSTELKPFQALEIEFSDTTVRFWTGYGELEADGETWSGIGAVLGISANTEVADLSAQGMTFTLSGLDTIVIAAILNENYKLRPITLYLGALDADNQPVSTLYQQFSGRMDTINITEDGQSATITINAENRLIDLQRPRIRKYTHQEQLNRYGDKSFALVATIADRKITWGKVEI